MRVEGCFAVNLPPRWVLMQSLADTYLKMGLFSTALPVFQQLQAWEGIIDSLMHLRRRGESIRGLSAFISLSCPHFSAPVSIMHGDQPATNRRFCGCQNQSDLRAQHDNSIVWAWLPCEICRFTLGGVVTHNAVRNLYLFPHHGNERMLIILVLSLLFCYHVLGVPAGLAMALIRRQLRLRPTPSLWCHLGDLQNDPRWYEKAWEVGHHILASGICHESRFAIRSA